MWGSAGPPPWGHVRTSQESQWLCGPDPEWGGELCRAPGGDLNTCVQTRLADRARCSDRCCVSRAAGIMGNSVVMSCCRRVTELLFPAPGRSLPDERSPLLLKAPPSAAGSVDTPGASWSSVPFPDVIPSTTAGGGLQERIECAQALPEGEGEAAVAAACGDSCSGAGGAAPLPVLPADLEEGPLEPLGCAVLPAACQGHVKPEDCGVACGAGPGAACGVLTCSVQPAGPRPGATSLLGNGSQRAASSESPGRARSVRTGKDLRGHGVAAPSALGWEKASGRGAVCSRNPRPAVQLSKQQKRRKKRKLLLLGA